MMMIKSALTLTLLLGFSGPLWASPSPQPIAKPVTPAVQILQKALKVYPGRVIELEQKENSSGVYYEIKILNAQGQIWELYFEITTGKLIRKNQKESAKYLSLQKIKALPLESFLERSGIKKPLEIELEIRQNQAIYEVKWLDAQGRLQKGEFDALTAKPLPKQD